MAGGGEYTWVMGDTGWFWPGPGPAPGCGPGCCGGCRVSIFRNLGKTKDNSDKFNQYVPLHTPNILSNYVTKQELESVLNELRGICDMSIDKENSARCIRLKGHLGFCVSVWP